ncbi:hypothetical protein F3Y22_tig00112344pilonHSYRG00035 [Hibiscus syriacus]|uniref:Uncharacterized protein n=1 Tax=Hibiscus syriacus TaxID=106335 RepID=A0A6A2XMC4_HIBSY|nr:hypothetical protein F3Y22_tig00112344pilonHSYRG00035 [Hibiscus syriacus]
MPKANNITTDQLIPVGDGLVDSNSSTMVGMTMTRDALVLVSPHITTTIMVMPFPSESDPEFTPEVPNNTVRCDIMKADGYCLISFGTIVYLKQKQDWTSTPSLPKVPRGSSVMVRSCSGVHRESSNTFRFRVSCRIAVGTRTIEALSSGVPVVAFPQWVDQVTNAVYLIDVFKIGVRMCRGEAENRLIPKEEIAKCFLEASTYGAEGNRTKEQRLEVEEGIGGSCGGWCKRKRWTFGPGYLSFLMNTGLSHHSSSRWRAMMSRIERIRFGAERTLGSDSESLVIFSVCFGGFQSSDTQHHHCKNWQASDDDRKRLKTIPDPRQIWVHNYSFLDSRNNYGRKTRETVGFLVLWRLTRKQGSDSKVPDPSLALSSRLQGSFAPLPSAGAPSPSPDFLRSPPPVRRISYAPSSPCFKHLFSLLLDET